MSAHSHQVMGRRSGEGTVDEPLSDEEVRLLDAYWRAANYLSVGQIYLLDNPLLREPLRPEHVKPRLLGHFGTTPGLNLIYAHLNRAIIQRETSTSIYVTRAGARRAGTGRQRLPRRHLQRGLPAHRAATRTGCSALFRQFSFPGGIPSHVAPETPGSIHEGGELGYALSHAFGAAFDNPDLLVACVVGDGEAETGPLATELARQQVPEPAHRRRGAADPAPERLQDRQPDRARAHPAPTSSTRSSAATAGSRSWVDVDATTITSRVHQQFAAALDEALDAIAGSSAPRASDGDERRPRWPMIVLRTPKGWTGPEEVDGMPGRGHLARAPGAALGRAREPRRTCALLEDWMRSYRPEELFDEHGAARSPSSTGWRRAASGA